MLTSLLNVSKSCQTIAILTILHQEQLLLLTTRHKKSVGVSLKNEVIVSTYSAHWAQRTVSSWQIFGWQECFIMTSMHLEECSITKQKCCVLGNLSSKNLRRLSARSIRKNQGGDSYILYKYTLTSTLNTHTMTLHELSIRAEWYTGRVEQGWKMATITIGSLSAFRLPNSLATSSPLIKWRQREGRKERYGKREMKNTEEEMG